MAIPSDRWNELKQKLDDLSESTVSEIFDFVEFMELKEKLSDSSADGSSLLLQQESLQEIWDDDPDLYEL